MADEHPTEKELTSRVVDELADAHDRNGIIQTVCEQTGLDWVHAEQWVQQVESEQAHTIAGKQNPLIILLSAAIVAAGVGLLFISVQGMQGNFHGDFLEFWGVILVLATNYPVTAGILGLSMIAGGIIGLYRHLLHYFST